MESSKITSKKILYSVVLVLLIITLVVGVTFAFFSTNTSNNGNVTVDVTTASQASIDFVGGNDVNFLAKQPGESTELYFSVSLNNPSKGTLSAAYDIKWNIVSNTFIHDVNNPNDKEIYYSLYVSLDNSTWETVFENRDITATTGVVDVAKNELISVGSIASKTNYYKMVITYPELNKDQSYNMQKSISSYVEVVASEE